MPSSYSPAPATRTPTAPSMVAAAPSRNNLRKFIWRSSLCSICRRPASDVALLRRLFITWVHDRIHHDRDQKDHTLDDVLQRVGDIHDRHAVEYGADQ